MTKNLSRDQFVDRKQQSNTLYNTIINIYTQKTIGPIVNILSHAIKLNILQKKTNKHQKQY